MEAPSVRACQPEQAEVDEADPCGSRGGAVNGAAPNSIPGDGQGQAADGGTNRVSGLEFFYVSSSPSTDEGYQQMHSVWELMASPIKSFSEFTDFAGSIFDQTLIKDKLQLGVSVLQLLLNMPREAASTQTAVPIQRQRDLLPLPLPPVGAMVKLLRLVTTACCNNVRIVNLELVKHMGKQQKSTIISRGTCQLWRLVGTIALNGMYLGWRGPLFRSWEDYTPAQKESAANIEKLVCHFCQNPEVTVDDVDFSSLVKQKGIDYTGEEISHALPVRLGEILPGLPDSATAGALNAMDVAGPEVRRWLGDPKQCLLPEEHWPYPLPKASMNVARGEWVEIAKTLVARNILVPIPKESIFQTKEGPLLNGMFAVLKKGKPGENQVRLTRLIMNFTPTNTLQVLQQGDLDTLAAASHWAGCQLPTGCALLWSGDDQRGAFYAWALPPVWRPFMAFRWPIPGEAIGRPECPEVWLASAVIPMGWINSVSLFQHLHRQLGLQPEPSGAGLPANDELRRDRPLPVSAGCVNGGWVSYYLDDFDCPEIVPVEMQRQLEGTMSNRHLQQRRSYARAGVQIAENKAHCREPKVERMGAEIDGAAGIIGSPRSKKLEVGFFLLWALRGRLVRDKVILMILGRLVRAFEFRRPLMSILNNCWPRQRQVRVPWRKKSLHELVTAIAVLPLAVADIRTPVSGLVTCSDASEQGGGLCGTAGLTPYGDLVLQGLEERCNDRENVWFKAAGSCSTPVVKAGPRVCVISLFDGIAALMVALSRLQCRVVAFAASEIDKACCRLVRTRWPGVIELGDITKIDHKIIKHLHDAVGYKIDLVIMGAGSPCQDLSGLKAGGQGLRGEKSKLFFEVPRVYKLVKEQFRTKVFSFVENVASMSEESVKEFSRELECVPVLIDAKYFTHCRRPRLFWATWGVLPQEGEELIDRGYYLEWVFPVSQQDPSTWLSPGCTWAGTLLPTFTRPQRRNKPPYKPAGLSTASREAIERWTKDSYYVQVYNYESYNMITSEQGHLRLPLLKEKELLMGFDKGYVSASFPPKTTPQQADLTGGQMLGNTFCVYPVMMLLHTLLSQHGAPSYRDWKQLVSIRGESPAGWTSFPKFSPMVQDCDQVSQLVAHVLRHADRSGTDVRLDLQVPFRTKAWPRSGFEASLFQWAIVHGYPWTGEAHINALELQAVLNAIKWRLRKAGRGKHRILHLVDSQVVAAILAKGRSSSFRLQVALSKYAALVVASGLVVAVGYVDTRDNPSDIPSRWFDK